MEEAFCVEGERKLKSTSSQSSTQISGARPGWGTASSSRCDEPPRSGARLLLLQRLLRIRHLREDGRPRGTTTRAGGGPSARLGPRRPRLQAPPTTSDYTRRRFGRHWGRGPAAAGLRRSAAGGARRARGEERPERRGVGRWIRGAAGGVEEAARPGKIFPTQRPRVDGRPRPRLRRRRGVEDEAAAVEVHDHRELFEAAAAAAGDLRDEEAGAQVVGDGGEPPAR